jgi:hypothetical protein
MTANLLFTQDTYDTQQGTMTYTFPFPQRFSNSEVALLNMTYYNCFFNITAAKGNNTIPFQIPQLVGGVMTLVTDTLVLEDGFYAVSDLNNALWSYFTYKGYYLYNPANGQNVYFASIIVNTVTYLCELHTFLLPTAADLTTPGNPAYQWQQPANGSLVLNTGSTHYSTTLTITAAVAPLLGFDFTVTTAANTQMGTYTLSPYVVFGDIAPAINPVTSVIMRCNLINARAGNPVDMIAQIPLVSAFGSIDQYQAQFPTFSDVVDGLYSTVVLSFMDQNKNPLKFFDPELTVTLQVRKSSGISQYQ